MEIKILKSKFMHNLFDQNTYILTKNDEALIVDAGAEIEDVETALNGKKVLAILITHVHFDHVWNIEKYIEKFRAPVYISDGAFDKFFDNVKNGSVVVRKNITFDVQEKNVKYYAEKLKLGSFEIEVFKTPGHTADSVSLLIEKSIFTGDLIFEDAVGRTDLCDSNKDEIKTSLIKLKTIDFDLIYPGHYSCFNKNHAEKIISLFL